MQPEFGDGETLYGAIRYAGERRPLKDIVRRTYFVNLDLAPANLELMERETPKALASGGAGGLFFARLDEALACAAEAYDVVIIDCPPQLGSHPLGPAGADDAGQDRERAAQGSRQSGDQYGLYRALETPDAPQVDGNHPRALGGGKNHAPQDLFFIRRMALDILKAHPDPRPAARKMKLALWRKNSSSNSLLICDSPALNGGGDRLAVDHAVAAEPSR